MAESDIKMGLNTIRNMANSKHKMIIYLKFRLGTFVTPPPYPPKRAFTIAAL